jgi:hypothetical protein
MMTTLLLLIIVGMIVFGLYHPFFHMHIPPVMSERVRKAYTIKTVLILGYWSVCIIFTFTLFFMAWLDIREIQRKFILARQNILHDIASGKEKKDKDE